MGAGHVACPDGGGQAVVGVVGDGTQYYLRLTADACPEVMARAQIRFGYVIPAPPGDEQ